jgi:hypothetical protein
MASVIGPGGIGRMARRLSFEEDWLATPAKPSRGFVDPQKG